MIGTVIDATRLPRNHVCALNAKAYCFSHILCTGKRSRKEKREREKGIDTSELLEPERPVVFVICFGSLVLSTRPASRGPIFYPGTSVTQARLPHFAPNPNSGQKKARRNATSFFSIENALSGASS
jgi:hypothetical protein